MNSPFDTAPSKEIAVNTRNLIFDLIKRVGLDVADDIMIYGMAGVQANPRTATADEQLLAMLAKVGYEHIRNQYLEAQNADEKTTTD